MYIHCSGLRRGLPRPLAQGVCMVYTWYILGSIRHDSRFASFHDSPRFCHDSPRFASFQANPQFATNDGTERGLGSRSIVRPTITLPATIRLVSRPRGGDAPGIPGRNGASERGLDSPRSSLVRTGLAVRVWNRQRTKLAVRRWTGDEASWLSDAGPGAAQTENGAGCVRVWTENEAGCPCLDRGRRRQNRSALAGRLDLSASEPETRGVGHTALRCGVQLGGRGK